MKEYEKTALIYSLKESNTLVLRIILISILVVGVISGAVYLYNLAISLFDSNPTSVQFTVCGVGCFIALLLQWISNVDANYRERIGEQPSTIKNIVQYLFAAIIIISFITMALTASLGLKGLVQHMAQHYFYCIITVHFCSCYFCLGLTFFLKKPENRAFFLINACPVSCHAVAAIPDVLLWPGQIVFQEHLLPFHE